MATRATLRIEDEGQHVVTLYKHFDGGPDWFGRDILLFVQALTLVNGIPYPRKPGVKYANGMWDLAAQLIVNFKDGPRDLYIAVEGQQEEWNYTLGYDGGAIWFQIGEGERRDIQETLAYLATYQYGED